MLTFVSPLDWLSFDRLRRGIVLNLTLSGRESYVAVRYDPYVFHLNSAL